MSFYKKEQQCLKYANVQNVDRTHMTGNAITSHIKDIILLECNFRAL